MFKLGRFLVVMQGAPSALTSWLGVRCGVENWGAAMAIGLLDARGQTVAAVGYSRCDGHDVMMHVAAISRSRWLSRRFLWFLFDYPFNHLKCARATVLIAENNHDSRRLAEGVGFKLEGVMRKGDKSGDDLLVYGMLKEECPWLNQSGRFAKEIAHEQIKAA